MKGKVKNSSRFVFGFEKTIHEKVADVAPTVAESREFEINNGSNACRERYDAKREIQKSTICYQSCHKLSCPL